MNTMNLLFRLPRKILREANPWKTKKELQGKEWENPALANQPLTRVGPKEEHSRHAWTH